MKSFVVSIFILVLFTLPVQARTSPSDTATDGMMAGVPPTVNGPCATLPAGSICTLPNTAALEALSTAGFPADSVVMRLGYEKPTDGGIMRYVPSPVACSLHGGRGDGGSEVPSANGKCWTWLPEAAGVPLEAFGGDGTAPRDDIAFAHAIPALQDYPKGQLTLLLGARTYNISRTITLTGPHAICIRGQDIGHSVIQSSPGSDYDLIQWGRTPVSAQQTQFGCIEKLSLQASAGAVGGYALAISHTANFTMRDVHIHTYHGIADEESNNNLYDNIWGYTTGMGGAVFLVHVTPDVQAAGGRTDQVTINNTHLSAGFYGDDCFVLRGMVQTINIYNDTFMQCKRGFFADASQNTSTEFPQFAFIYNLQLEGAQIAGVEIDGGRSFHFTDSTVYEFYDEAGAGGRQGNADLAGFYLRPDGSRSVTSDISWTGGWIGGGARYGAYLSAQGVRFANMAFRSGSRSAAKTYPSVETYRIPHKGRSDEGNGDYQFSGVKFCGVYGDPVQDSYGLVMGSVSGSVLISNGNFNYCNKGNVNTNGSSVFLMTGSILRNSTLVAATTRSH